MKRPVVGSVWQRKPPGKEVVRVSRVWEWNHPRTTDPRDDGWVVRVHPVKGGKPLICPIFHLLDAYDSVPSVGHEAQPAK